jgi:hypothetical protein
MEILEIMTGISESDLIPKFEFTGKEHGIVEHILDNIDEISFNSGWGKIERVKRGYTMFLGNTRIIADIMIWHTDGTGTAIEVKRTNTNRNDLLTAIGQVLFYGLHMEARLKNMPRLVIASPEINSNLLLIKKRFDLPICFLMVDGNRCIYLS